MFLTVNSENLKQFRSDLGSSGGVEERRERDREFRDASILPRPAPAGEGFGLSTSFRPPLTNSNRTAQRTACSNHFFPPRETPHSPNAPIAASIRRSAYVNQLQHLRPPS